MTRTRNLKRFLAIISLLHPLSVPLEYFRSCAKAPFPPAWITVFLHHGRWSESRYLGSLTLLKEDGMIQIHSSGSTKSLSVSIAGIKQVSELCKTQHYDLVKEASLVALTHLNTICGGNLSHDVNDGHIVECLDHAGSWLWCTDQHSTPLYPAKNIKHALVAAQLFLNHDRNIDAERLYSYTIQLAKLDLRRYHSKLTLAIDKLVQIYLDRQTPLHAEQVLDNTWRLLRVKLGPLHVATLMMVEAMAVYFCSQGRIAAGEQLFRLILSTRPREYRQTSMQYDIAGDIAGKLFDQGIVQEICEQSGTVKTPELLQKHLPIMWRKWNHDKEVPSMAITLLSAQRNLGLALTAQGRYVEAWEILSDATRWAMTSTTPKIAVACVEALSICASWKGLAGDALKLCSEAYTLAVAHLGAGHAYTEEIYNSLSLALQLKFSRGTNASPPCFSTLTL